MTAKLTTRLADFVTTTQYTELPPEVAEYTKLVILDTIICGIAAGNEKRTKMMHQILLSMGGHEEASVFGLDQRVPSSLAAMANAEAMNLLDADDTFFTSSHFAAFNVAAALAEAQRANSSGKDMILAAALGFDINARLNLALQVIAEADDGSFKWASVQGMGFATMGVAATSAVIRKLSARQMFEAFGIASWIAPTPTASTMSSRTAHPSFKYANYPTTAQSGVLAAMFAEVGYVGEEAGGLDDDRFTLAQGCFSTDSELLLDELGTKWWILETAIKFYPSCRYTHPPIDMLRRLMEQENLSPTDIDKIIIYLNPMAYALKIFREPPSSIDSDHCAPFTGAFHIPYVLALVAHGKTPGPDWYNDENINDPTLWAFTKKIETAENTAAREDVTRALRETRIRRFRKTPATMKVIARGREYLCEAEYADGDPWTEDTKADWDKVTDKFVNFCGSTMSEKTILSIVENIRHLENVDNVNSLLQL
tara:strand:- start:17838 stop:19283 length:1446 start_codon:yes stop_codon:yes gene_type:complete